MDKRKKYLIEIFLKKCSIANIYKKQLDFYFKWCENTYNVSSENLEKIKKKFTIDEYINRLIPVIDKYFSAEELKELIKFYSSKVGRKIIDFSFITEVGEVGSDMNIQIEKEFILNNV